MKRNTSPGSKTNGTESANGRAKNEIKLPALLGSVLESVPLKPELTPADQKELIRLETVIQNGWTTFLEVGSALLKINADRLYRDKYETFEAYCHERLGLSRPYAYSLIGSAEVNEQMSAIADIPLKPLTESQFRELIPVPEAKRVAAWMGALKLAGDKPVTANFVRQAAAKFKSRKTSKPAKSAKKPTPSTPDLQPALKLVDDIEKIAQGKGNELLLSKVKALRKCLLGMGGK
jgi:hypothetical protein